MIVNKRLVSFIQNLLLVILSLSPFVVLEVGLRLFDYGYTPSLYLRHNETGQYVVNSQISRKYIPLSQRSMIPNFFQFASFSIEKPANTFRIFCLGGSTTAGEYPALLQSLLNKTASNKKIEVINLGAVSLNSFQVVDFVDEIVDYQPDLLVIYAGHNEIYGPLGVASGITANHSYMLTNLIKAMQQSRLFQLLQNSYQKIAMVNTDVDVNTESDGLFKSFAGSVVLPRSELRIHADDYFQKNLQKIIVTAKKNQTPLLLATVVSNIRQFKPFDSAVPDVAQKASWNALIKQAIAARERQQYVDSEQLFRQAIALFSDNAQQYFEFGQLYLLTGRYELAQIALTKARDFDILPFRATSETNTIIRNAASRSQVLLLDVEKIFAQHSDHGIIGKPLLLEHLHPTRYGYYIMATEIAKLIYKEQLLTATTMSNFLTPEYMLALGIKKYEGQFTMGHVWPFSINNADYKFP